MTKKRALPLLLLALVIAAVALFIKNRTSDRPMAKINKSHPARAHKINSEKLEIDGKKVVGLKKGKEKSEIQNLKVANSPSPEWKTGLEDSLKVQGGKSLKEIKFETVDSFVWANDGVALFVESVIVSVKNDKNLTTTFRVLVDAQNGKILRNWDQPVFDPVNPREGFRIRIDPRYHND